ncbi:MAG: M14 family metallopeptidase [Saprospiraceae bacterium]|nr:M14 family metallopeptidase [Saprospiraceae bacterium]
MLKQFSISVLFLFISGVIFAQLQSPDEFLPHNYGKQFTPYYMIVDYVKHVANNSDRVQLKEYGRTNQDRPLLMAIISTPENLAKAEDIRKNNLRRSGLEEGRPTADNTAIVWLSFGVHGNEAGGPESSLAVLYALARAEDKEVQSWLENTIVILDPTLNPDGNSRYTHWYRNVANQINDPNPEARSHNEPWPGGRINHYLFDLNRDWAWQTQVESRLRIDQYMQWMPHIHVDFHEQFHNNPYYFAPAARPYHEYLTEWQADFQFDIGKNHAKYFDKNGWLYFTREVFDLLYPSYGDTWPMFHGAIGMTYEQGGHSRAGRGITMENEDILTLRDRIDHHRTTGLSTVEVASKNAKRMIEKYTEYYQKSSSDPKGEYKTYIIKGDNPAGKINSLLKYLERNHIQFGLSKSATTVTAFDYITGQDRKVKVESDDIIVSAYQPLSVMTQVLLDPKTAIEDSLTYDITSWSLLYACGLEAYATKQKMEVVPFVMSKVGRPLYKNKPAPYAYLYPWESLEDAQFLGNLLERGIKVRFASEPFKLEGVEYERGTLVITRADNRKMGANFAEQVERGADNRLIEVSTGFSDSGHDLGSAKMVLIKQPKIALLSGEQTSANAFGATWHFFEQDLKYPISVFDANRLGRIDLSAYNLLVMPEGWYGLSDNLMDKLNDWISDGGRLIAVGRACNSLRDKKGMALTKYASNEEKNKADQLSKIQEMEARLNHYTGQERRWISESMPGAIYKLQLDNTHPLGYGLEDYYFSLKTSSLFFQHIKNAWNVGIIGEDPMVSGFAGLNIKKKMENTTVFAVQDKGQGSITYMVDDPLFRGFWENGKFLFSNAVFFVGQ